MGAAFDILGITFPIFSVVALGYLAVWKGPFSSDDMTVLGRFVLNISLPALMFLAASGAGEGRLLSPSYMLAYLAAGLATLGLAFVWFQINPFGAPTGPARRAIAAMGTACPNSAYMGYPVLLLAVPEVASRAFAMNILVESFVIVPLSFLLLGATRSNGQGGVLRVAWDAAWDVVRRPMVLGFLAGFAVNASGLSVPAPLDRLVTTLATTTVGIALFVIGGNLVRLPLRGNVLMAGEIVTGKLLLHPALALAATLLLLPLGFAELSEPLFNALILSCAMPMFGIYAILAQDYGHEGLASLGLFGATVGAFFTLSGLLFWLL